MAMRTPSAKPKWGKPARQGTKMVKKLEQTMAEGLTLTPANATLYRALSARANYLSQDMPDLSFTAKELCREFAVPTLHSFERLKGVIRYLAGTPRLVMRYKWQEVPKQLVSHVDTDFAGCAATRRSTSGGTFFLGSHLVKHDSSTQSTVSLSSGEAELHGLSK